MIKKLLLFCLRTIKSFLSDDRAIVLEKIRRRIHRHILNSKPKKKHGDILFINGTYLDHPRRYRVSHQMEQLRASNLTCDEIWYENIDINDVKRYRGFIIFRCPLTDKLEQFIKTGKSLNKTFFYDIDDLVFDRKYTTQISYLKTLDEKKLAEYNYGLDKNQECMRLCDFGITTTPILRNELLNFFSEVIVNRNVASEEMVKLSLSENTLDKNNSKIKIGYSSGSITHNEDLELIEDVLEKILRQFPNVQLHLMGLIEVPESLKHLSNQIITQPFVDWKKLPHYLASLDINIAPLKNTLFNQAKSENKWTEAALLGVPTVASNVGAFSDVIVNWKTGVLCNNNQEWFDSLSSLIENREQRVKIGNQAKNEVLENHTTLSKSLPLTNFITEKLAKNIAFIVPGTTVRGGINVIVKHAQILLKNGFDVTLISMDKNEDDICYPSFLPVLSVQSTDICAFFNKLVATLWATTHFVNSYPKCTEKFYLVQNFETGFYQPGDERRLAANSTYFLKNYTFVTISKWCHEWLISRFNQEARYASNGIDLTLFKFVEKDFSKKIIILIEGNSEDKYKNVDESFEITNQLDHEKFEIWYLSYDKGPKKNYHVDKYFSKIPYEKVNEIYQKSHILLKSSLLESFSYPPLEMMATGGIAVVAENEGIKEYAKDNENCLIYKPGNTKQAIKLINKVVEDSTLRNLIINNGRNSAELLNWKSIESHITHLYD